jgi:hypothetical protein
MRRYTRSSPKKHGMPDLTYPVGYARPPEHSQFKKGQSGNSNGRPKGSRNWSTVFAEELARPIVRIIDGNQTTITVLDALIRDAVDRAVSGSMRHIQLLLRNEYREPPERLTIIFEGKVN